MICTFAAGSGNSYIAGTAILLFGYYYYYYYYYFLTAIGLAPGGSGYIHAVLRLHSCI